MRLGVTSLQGSFDRAFDGLLAAADRLDAAALNRRPHGEGTNAPAALVVHCCGVCEFWLGHVALGRPSHRDRDAELVAEATHAELRELVAATRTQVAADLDALDRGDGGMPNEVRAFLPGDGGDDEAVLHALEELYQHLGHLEVTADALGG